MRPGGSAESGAGASQAEGLYSIGAVAAMVGVQPATLRTWEERYRMVSPGRTRAGQRLYSRAQVEQLRFVAAEIERGASAADAHRLLAGRAGSVSLLEGLPGSRGPRILILVAARDKYSAELIEFLLRTEGFQVELALDVEAAEAAFERVRPDLTVIEFLIHGGAVEQLCRWLKQRSSAPILVLSALDVPDRALQAGADAFLLHPVGHLALVSAVKDLLGVSAVVRRSGEVPR